MGDSNFWSTVLPFALVLLAMYFLLLRPQQKRLRKQQEMVSSLQPGARVMTTAGLYGTLAHVGERQAIIEIAPGVELTIARQAIARVVSAEDEDFEYADDTDAAATGPDAAMTGSHAAAAGPDERFGEAVVDDDAQARGTGFERPVEESDPGGDARGEGPRR